MLSGMKSEVVVISEWICCSRFVVWAHRIEWPTSLMSILMRLTMRSLSRVRWKGHAEEVAARVPRSDGGEVSVVWWLHLFVEESRPSIQQLNYPTVVTILCSQLVIKTATCGPYRSH